MARCDEGYLCEVCGTDVAAIAESDLYLRYVLGEVPLEQLHLLPERHIRCNPGLAQYIVDADFAAVARASKPSQDSTKRFAKIATGSDRATLVATVATVATVPNDACETLQVVGAANVQCYTLRHSFRSTVSRSRPKTRNSRRQEPSGGARNSSSSISHRRHHVAT